MISKIAPEGARTRDDAAATAWVLIAATALMTATAMSAAGISFDWSSALKPFAAVLALMAVVAAYRSWRPHECIETALTSLAQIAAFTAIACPLSYALASTGGVLWDETFLSWDRALGLEWRAYLDFVNARPELGLVYTLAYRSILPQVALILIVLGLGGRLLQCREFVLAFIIASVTTIVVSAFTPAVAMFVHLGLTPDDFANLSPAAAFVHADHVAGLRDGSLREFSLDGAEGIITFPSLHAALAVILAHALWHSKWTRWPGLALNGLMILATPIDGGHYFVDVIAGGVVAVFAIQAARLLERRPIIQTDIAFTKGIFTSKSGSRGDRLGSPDDLMEPVPQYSQERVSSSSSG